jgi:hypothetical protein
MDDDAQDADDELGGSEEAHRADEDEAHRADEDDVDPRASPNQPKNRMTAPMSVQTPMFNEVRMIVPTNKNIRWSRR